ncbi:tripartite tricarboxylate transporter substrate binding protein [Bradyrhizobium sp. LHD-71]|uniref:Bug family tripartite tricarboxylate transporter substrate binding protein n=1 Tax=Bradyrhizobium sp. LHD-71 TaxID=3072141 RepID=UPI00280CD29A|nr:tripartite tricarboxylate transporter substrate binding protein [Bradyrhizobium sp. LHD-71]MDQ8726220.1 tripartite tricarboxylate transporter substrate binding protein [Bradyrhizobium sp. LHD-71]
MKIAQVLLTALAAFGLATTASAQQDYPNRPITWVVPFTPAGQADTAARVLAKVFGDKIGQQIVIDNRPGAGGIIGAEMVMNAKPDGYTIFYGSSGPMGILPKLHKNLSYDPVKNFVPIAAVAVSPLVLLIPPGKPYKTFKEFVDYARKNPEKLTFSSVGIGSTQHLGGEMLSIAIGSKMVHVPYKGSAPAVLDLMAGRIDVAFDNYAPNKGHIDAGKMIPIGVAAEKRLTSLPDVPTLGELEFPEVVMASWSSLAAPAGTPAPVVDKIANVMVETMADPGVQKFYNDAGSTILDKRVKDKAREFYISEGNKFKLLIEKSGATAE